MGGNFIKKKLLLVCFVIIFMITLTGVNATDNSTDCNDDLIESGKINANVNASADSVSVGEDVLVKVSLNKSATGKIIVDDNYQSNVSDGNATIIIPNLEMGSYNFTVHYSGDDNFLESDTYVVFNVNKNKTAPQITGDENINFGETAHITIKLPEDATGSLNIFNDTSNYTVELTSNVIYIECENLGIGRHGIVAEYSGNRKYEKISSSFFFNVNYDLIVTSDAKYSEDVIVRVSIFEGVTGNITITGDDISLNSTLSNGYCEVNLGVLDYGKHNISVCFLGNDKYPKLSVNHTISVGANIVIDDEVIYQGHNEITFELPENARGKLSINISGLNEIVIDVVNGTASYSLSNLTPGDYSVTINYSGDDNYFKESLYTIITVIPQINLPDEITTGVNEFNIKLPQDAGGNLTIGVDGDETTKKIENGSCTIYLDNIESGEHIISIIYTGDGKYDEYSLIISTEVVKLTPDLNINIRNDLVEGDTGVVNIYTAIDANGILLIDFNGNRLYTNIVSGYASTNLGVLSKGVKNVVYTFLGDDKYKSVVKTSSFNVLSQVRIASGNLNMYYLDGSSFAVQIFGNDEKPVAGDVVSFTIKGRTYHVRTNGNGYAYLKINSKAGRYTIITTYKTTQVANTIVVKHILKSRNVKIKNSTKKFSLKAQLKKHLKGKKITFKVNGKKVKAKTNSKGIAKVTFKKGFVKKLKKGKKYSIKITYGKETIKKTLKVNK